MNLRERLQQPEILVAPGCYDGLSAMLIEQAGGKASTAFENIMEVEPTAIHQRVSVVMGSAEEVDNALRYHA